MKILNSHRDNQIKEKQFLNFLLEQLPDAELIEKTFKVSNEIVRKPLDIGNIKSLVSCNRTISESKKAKVLRELDKLPTIIKVALRGNDISVDFAIKTEYKLILIEFHEEQHSIDSNKRSNKIYTLEGIPVNVPRYLQRFLRDVWRYKHLDNFKVVWYDWFECNEPDIKDLLSEGNKEYASPNKLRISDFL